jgi:hypothetical protein
LLEALSAVIDRNYEGTSEQSVYVIQYSAV